MTDTSSEPYICPCDDDYCPAILEAMARFDDMTPKAAVAAAAKELPISPFVCLVAAEARIDPCYRRAGAARMFLQHLLNGRRREDFPHWYYPLMGVVNIWDGICEDESEEQDFAILERLRSAYWKILEIIWDDRHFLFESSDPMADDWKAIVSFFFKFYLNDLRSKKKLYERRAMLLVMHCWCETASDSRHQDIALEGVFELWELGKEHYPTTYLDMLFDVVDVEKVVAHFKRILTYKGCIAYTLAMELQAMFCLIMRESSPLLSRLIKCNIYKELIKATRRQLKTGEEDIDLILRNACSILLQILDKTPQPDKFMDTYTDILENRWVVEAGSLALIRAQRSDDHENTKPWCRFFAGICHILECKGSQQCPSCQGPPPASFVNAAKASFERIAIPTVTALGSDSRYAALWNNLLFFLEITPESVRERYRLDRKCCNLDCPARNSRNRSEKKATCVRCQSVYYCDRSCQKSDWPFHKSECEIFCKGAPSPGVA